MGQLAVVQREHLAAGLLDSLDHLELHLQRADQTVEVRDENMVGFIGLDHLDRGGQAETLGQRQPAADVDLAKRLGDDPLAPRLGPPLGGVRLHLGRVEVLAIAVALARDTEHLSGSESSA